MLRCIALSACAATVAGLLSYLALRRLGGIESGPIRRPHRAQHGENRLDSLTYGVTRYVPMSEKVADATRDMLSRSGVTMPAASFWAIRVASLSAGIAAGLLALPFIGGVQGIAAAAACAVGTRMDGAIAAAFARVAKEAAYSSRSEALLGLAERAQVNSITFFAASLVQAERAGSSLVDIIRMQAQSVRTERRLKVDDITNKLSTKMLFPMLLLMLPSIIMLMLAPMILQLGEFF